MRILHYFLGVHRQGGLNRYAADLAAAQAAAGHSVFALFPGGGVLPRHRMNIRRRQTVSQVEYHELLGGAPVPLLEGICDPAITLNHPNRLSERELKQFCDRVRPDVLHVHTWMGFPPELMEELKRRRVRIVFTTHDYFGLCPRVNFIDTTECFCSAPDNGKCSRCNLHAPGARYLALRNWSFLLKLRPLLTPIRNLRHGRKNGEESAVTERNYMALLEYYRQLLLECDSIHFNSPVSAAVYRKFLPELPGEIIPITHAGIADRRSPHIPDRQKVRFCFIGPRAPYKGLPLLLRVLEALRGEGITNWSLDIWGCAEPGGTDSIRWHGPFNQSERERIFSAADLLIVPSIWAETFGFVVEEALSSGLPVLCSDMVGAQILVSPEMVYHGETGLYQALKRILESPQSLETESRAVCASPRFKTMDAHVGIMNSFYQTIGEH
ncbi:MAG: glycosyltransferase [Lentisphaeria bacterium]|nr:glycosyltransferase [Lentisphaeria bacterium]